MEYEKQIFEVAKLEADTEYRPKNITDLKDSPKLDWVITLRVGNQSMKFDYHQGYGHIPDLPQNIRMNMNVLDAIKHVFKTGKYGKFQNNFNAFNFSKRLPAPDLTSLVWCMCLDASVLQYPNFEEWAGDMGYDSDSREAEKSYNLCLKQALEFKNLVGGETVIEKLNTILEDY